MAKGSVGTSCSLVYIKDKRKKIKWKGAGGVFCVKCRGWIYKGEWCKPTYNRCYVHLRCPNAQNAAQPRQEELKEETNG